MKFSVLISVYKGDDALFLKQALESIWDYQNCKPNEIVIIKDGKLTLELDSIVDNFAKKAPVVLFALDENKGLGEALRIGVGKCQYKWIARMDSDDIAHPDRFNRQFAFLKNNESIDVLGSLIQEFTGSLENLTSTRVVPERHLEIRQRHKLKNAVNHVTVIINKEKLLSSGNYQSMLFFEDYFLWARMMMNKCKFYNLQESLVYVRVGNDMIGRRKGFFYAKNEMIFYKSLFKINFLTFLEFIKAVMFRVPLRFLPRNILSFFYKRIVRS
ncbi:glycosyltransferase [Aquimarina sp. Aq107]|uniref:glycosyltransferase n=1 Tax=Aquimarina sp. Aq107 TaxID=1191912 RepID=UPI000D55B87F|nr:glycosyltransferase [Aquimarina sp. Aq107]